MTLLKDKVSKLFSNGGTTPSKPLSVMKAIKDSAGTWTNDEIVDVESIQASRPKDGLFYNVLVGLESEETIESIELAKSISQYIESKGWFLRPTDEFNGCQRYMVMDPKLAPANVSASASNEDLPF